MPEFTAEEQRRLVAILQTAGLTIPSDGKITVSADGESVELQG